MGIILLELNVMLHCNIFMVNPPLHCYSNDQFASHPGFVGRDYLDGFDREDTSLARNKMV